MNAFTAEAAGRRVGLLLRPKVPVGDFDRAAAAAKGDVDDAKASKPDAERFVPVGEEISALVEG